MKPAEFEPSRAAAASPWRIHLSGVTLLPYLAVGLAWFAFLMIAFRVRMIEPVFLWVYAHGMIVETTFARQGFWTARALLLAAYLAAAIFAWFLIELGGRDPDHVWRRAVVGWIGIQVVFCAIAAFLLHTGVLHE